MSEERELEVDTQKVKEAIMRTPDFNYANVSLTVNLQRNVKFYSYREKTFSRLETR